MPRQELFPFEELKTRLLQVAARKRQAYQRTLISFARNIVCIFENPRLQTTNHRQSG